MEKLRSGLKYWLGCRFAADEEESQGASQSDEEASYPDGLRGNVIVEKSADNRRQGTRQTPSQPMNRHITAAQIGGCEIRYIFAGGGNECQLTKCKDNHAQPKSPKAAHQRYAACADRIDKHANSEDRKGSITASDLCDRILCEDTQQAIRGGNPAIETFRHTKICLGVHRHQDPKQCRCDQANTDRHDKHHEAFVAQD